MRKELRIVFAEHGFDVAYIPSMDDDNGNTLAARIVDDHNACLGIVDPETTVPELVKVLRILSRRNPFLVQEAAVNRARELLAKTGQTTPPASAD